MNKKTKLHKKFLLTIMSALMISMPITTKSFALEESQQNTTVDQKTIQEQQDFFEELDKQIQSNPDKMIEPDKQDDVQKVRTKRSLRSSRKYPTRKGVILVTSDGKYGQIFGHAGIIYKPDKTIESFPASGLAVASGKERDGVYYYNNNWNYKYKKAYGLNVKNTSKSTDASAADYAKAYIGRPYNWNFLDTETAKKFYCSQLVYKAYKYKAHINLNYGGGPVHPMDLVKTKHTSIIYAKGV
ncbi:YiiX/YebB-like N1pC/P60 family cysteine hydrolase [Terrisporobacter petrolearius]|uniref:YiiX/YebB-like N1pC/P60 family cysteine hydrolase n=1 Tax=Terrisporobacter petrolearius TaxID=1460447 RepID=UPI003AFFC554